MKTNIKENEYQGLVKEPHPSPIARKNFIPDVSDNILSCDGRNLEARLWIEKNKKPRKLALGLPLKWEINKHRLNEDISYENYQRYKER